MKWNIGQKSLLYMLIIADIRKVGHYLRLLGQRQSIAQGCGNSDIHQKRQFCLKKFASSESYNFLRNYRKIIKNLMSFEISKNFKIFSGFPMPWCFSYNRPKNWHNLWYPFWNNAKIIHFRNFLKIFYVKYRKFSQSSTLCFSSKRNEKLVIIIYIAKNY